MGRLRGKLLALLLDLLESKVGLRPRGRFGQLSYCLLLIVSWLKIVFIVYCLLFIVFCVIVYSLFNTIYCLLFSVDFVLYFLLEVLDHGLGIIS